MCLLSKRKHLQAFLLNISKLNYVPREYQPADSALQCLLAWNFTSYVIDICICNLRKS